mgnify:CR=1 FL=1
MELGRGGHRDWWRGRGGEDLVQVGDAEVHPGHQQQPRVLRVLVPGQPGEQREGLAEDHNQYCLGRPLQLRPQPDHQAPGPQQ